MIGTVVRFLAPKAYAFIKPDDGTKNDVFFHLKQLAASGLTKLDVGTRVSFETELAPNGKTRAIDIAIVT